MHNVLMVLVIALVTLLTRALPFLFFPAGQPTPKIFTYFGKVLPPAVMSMLVVYCFRNTEILAYPHGLPELIAGSVVVLTYIWKKNTLISIVTGTLLYMYLIQSFFA